jgi:methyl-accepting chemotaxis protein
LLFVLFGGVLGGGVMVMCKEIAAPIRIQGKHWGGFRTAYKI